MKQHTQKWFTTRIGKRIYRLTKTNCCKECDEVYKNGLIIHNKEHAYCLKMYQDECLYFYRDKK